MRRRPVTWVLVLLVALLATACGPDRQPDAVSWRNIDVELPDDWYLFEEDTDRLSIANEDIGLGEEPGVPREAPDGDVVAMFFTYEPDTTPADWRDFVEEQGATLETDDRLLLAGEVPATRLVFSYESNGTPTREMVVLIPSRAVVVLAQPVPLIGDSSAPQVFLDHVETFLAVIEGLELGAPVLD